MRLVLSVLVASLCLAAQNPPLKSGATAAKSPRPATNPRLLNPALFRAKAPDLYRAKFTTTKGDFVVEVKRQDAPLGADRFYNLVKAGFYSGVSFYRVLANALVQFGLSPNPAVTKAWSTAPIKDDPVKLGNKPGVITFANAGPNTRTTQLFINMRDMSGQLDTMGFAGFGTVTEGMEVVKNLYSGYGEMKDMGGAGPDQDLATKQGAAYLDKNFPSLDKIVSAAIVFPEPTAAPAKAAPKAAPKASPKK